MRTPETVAGMQCPVCQVGLAICDRQGIEIDYCPQCRGAWLDRGGVEKIILGNGAGDSHSASPHEGEAPPRRRGHALRPRKSRGHDDYARYPQEKWGSCFEKLFD